MIRTGPKGEEDERVERVFGALGQPVVIDKGIVRDIPSLGRVPRYVAEFLLAMGLPKGRSPGEIADDLLASHPASGEQELWLHRLVQDGSITVIDLAEVRVDLGTGAYSASLRGLGISPVEVSPDVADRNPGLLAGGLWGRLALTWEPRTEDDDRPPVRIERFDPVQVRASLEPFLEGRPYFSADLWMNLLLRSAGYEPEALAHQAADLVSLRRTKLLLLTRLAPLVEPNLNLIEMGPKNTGKTYLLRNVSPRAYVLSGGSASVASLFMNLATRRLGLLAQRKVVVFDEIARLRLGSAESVAILKDYLESGTFGRAGQSVQSDCSVVFTGNIEVEGTNPSPRYRHLLEPLPAELRDSAFVDRLHGFLPGWELPKLTPDSFARGLGFVSDYFGAVLLKLRDHPYGETYADLSAERPPLEDMTRRDAVSCDRLARALLKMVFPLGAAPEDRPLVDQIFDLAGELRQRLHDQLCRMAPGEFSPRQVGFAHPGRPFVSESFSTPSSRLRPLAVGEAYFLDYRTVGEGAEAAVRLVEVSVLPNARGLVMDGHLDRLAQSAVKSVFQYLRANLRSFGLPPDWLDGRGLAVAVPDGPVGDGAALGLPVFLAVASAILGVKPSGPVVACGPTSLHGALQFPASLVPRVSLLEPVPGGHLVLPAASGSIPAVPQGWEVLRVRDLAHALQLIGTL